MATQYDILADASLGMPATLTPLAPVGAHDYLEWTNANGVTVRLHVVHATVYAAPAKSGSSGVLGCEAVGKPPPPPPP